MTELIPTQQKQVTFYESEITAVLIDGDVYASIRHMCQALGLDTQGQTQRIGRNEVLSDGLMVCVTHTIQGERPTNVLRADLVPMWLTGVSTRRLDDNKRARLIDFQKRAAKILWQAFQRGELTDNLDIDALAEAGDEVAETYQIGRAIMTLARNHLQLRQQMSQRFADYDRRLESLETAVSSADRVVSEAQAMEVSQAVKAIAMILSKQTKSNQYGAIYGEMYRRYSITSYKQLPASKFADCMDWLNEWRDQLESETF